jgi:sortase (surface protein transpeptidase)
VFVRSVAARHAPGRSLVLGVPGRVLGGGLVLLLLHGRTATATDGPHKAEPATRAVAPYVATSWPHVRAATSKGDAFGPPVRVVIPSIGVDARVTRLGLNPDGTLEVPANFNDAGWWSGGTVPGERGPAVIVGHVDSKAGPAVFYRLRELGRGDVAIVHGAGGSVAQFVVRSAEQVAKNNFPTDRVYGETPNAALRLITCGGAFDDSAGHYVDNLVIYARLKGS